MIRVADVVAAAQARLGLGEDTAAYAQRIRREDRPGDSFYFLVILGEPLRPRGVAAVDAATGDVMEWADLPGTRPHLTVKAPEAKSRAGFPGDAKAEMVWRPCRASRSPLYPIWRLSFGDRVAFVDQQGVVWDSLEMPETGG